MNKQQFRDITTSTIRSLSISVKQLKERSINEQIVNIIKERDNQVVLLYNALPDEVDVRSSILFFLEQGRVVLLPKVIDETCMELYRISSLDDCVIGSFGVLEPDVSKTIIRSGGPIDVGIIPGRVFDRYGGRIGRGRGYYDRLLAKYPEMKKIGVCFEEQLIDEVVMEERDVRMNKIVYA